MPKEKSSPPLRLVRPTEDPLTFGVEHSIGGTTFRFRNCVDLTTILEYQTRDPGAADWERRAMHLDTDMDAALLIQKRLVQGDLDALDALLMAQRAARSSGSMVVLEYRPFPDCYALTQYLPRSKKR